ncbi:uncharacterized protein LOC118181006 [Stegodyphus dumicola]|uniref:uncharacterized protein LOC118181006 n=1 Tax=Stegodyphus dumicola TaxID=202533 RepID=UPI0015ADE7DC|nr:uncharacterized protein LOC118181006 [Stegodyphus dumicola]
MQEFSEEIDHLKKRKLVCPRSKLKMLNPCLDDEGILRVGGRLRNASIAQNVKYPVILAKSHYITELIIRYYHYKYLHGGAQMLHSEIKQRYWIINAQAAIHKIIRKCVTCCRHRSELSYPAMGDLPASRVNPARAFSKCGVDFSSPFQVKPTKGRGVRTVKIDVCVFVCFSTKAVHLEQVGDMTTYSFIAALKRFIARLGRPEEMYSDCGTNFIGANRQLKSYRSNQKVVRYLIEEEIKWNFNPSSAPHFGGLWEAAVKAMKYHMRRAIGSQVLTFEEFATYLAEVEACLNSRPLVAISSDPDDFSVITPSHFLIGTSLKAIPEPNVCDETLTLRNRWKLVQQMSQSFWRKWSKDYLTQLQVRTKWHRASANIKLNDLVIIKEDNTPSLKWKLGRITEIYPGNDYKVRVVKVKTADVEFKRPIHKLCVLPIDS